MAKRRKARYSIATEIGIRLKSRMSDETLEFIKKVDPELYKLIMDE